MNFTQLLLWPLTLPYGAATRLRALAYKNGVLRQRRLDAVVISVGNLTTGGTGKTPMVLWIAERLLAEGKKAGILTRGYRGKESAGGRTSDEVQLLRARLGDRVAFGVGANRFAEGQKLSAQGVEWLILDDGLQHLQIARDVDVALIDATNPFGGGHLLPAGRLREPKSALERANIIVVTRSLHAPAIEAVIRRESDAPIFYARTQIESVHIWRGEHPGPADSDWLARRFFAFCGIGNPTAFVSDLRQAGFEVLGHRFFPDHHQYRQRDADAIEVAARQAGGDRVICTEKDVFNLANARWKTARVCYVRISLHVDRADELWRQILAVADSRRRFRR